MNLATVFTGLDIGISQEEIDAFRARFELLTDLQRHSAILQAHGANYERVAKMLGISTDKFHRQQKVILKTMECTRDELPKATFASLGVLISHSL